MSTPPRSTPPTSRNVLPQRPLPARRLRTPATHARQRPRHRCGHERRVQLQLSSRPAHHQFLGIDPEALRNLLAEDKTDGEVLEWINANAQNKRTPWEIEQWSDYQQRRGPDGDVETLQFFAERVGSFAKDREDIRTWADLLDLDDYVTFGGRP
jgi:hypothetical protein